MGSSSRRAWCSQRGSGCKSTSMTEKGKMMPSGICKTCYRRNSRPASAARLGKQNCATLTPAPGQNDEWATSAASGASVHGSSAGSGADKENQHPQNRSTEGNQGKRQRSPLGDLAGHGGLLNGARSNGSNETANQHRDPAGGGAPPLRGSGSGSLLPHPSPGRGGSAPPAPNASAPGDSKSSTLPPDCRGSARTPGSIKPDGWEQRDTDELIMFLSGAGFTRLSLDGDYFEGLKVETRLVLGAASQAVSASRMARNLLDTSVVNGPAVYNKIKALQRIHGCQELGFRELHDGAMDRYMEAEGSLAAGETDTDKIRRLSRENEKLKTILGNYKRRLSNWSAAIGGSDQDEAREAKRQMASYVGKFCKDDQFQKSS